MTNDDVKTQIHKRSSFHKIHVTTEMNLYSNKNVKKDDYNTFIFFYKKNFGVFS